MAVMLTDQKKMVYWRMEIGSSKLDITNQIGKFVSNITVTDKTSEPKNKKKAPPSELKITMKSPQYIEELFTKGVAIKVWMGYDRVIPPLVFEGVIDDIPDGNAREMLNLTITAHSKDVLLSFRQRTHTYRRLKKDHIVAIIAARNNLIPYIRIDNTRMARGQFSPKQMAETDSEFLTKISSEWDCIWWVDSGTLYFADAEKAHGLGSIISQAKGKPFLYTLGFRTDKAKNTVEQVAWSKKTSAGGSQNVSMLKALGQRGARKAMDKYKIKVGNDTYQFNKMTLDAYGTNRLAFGKFAREAAAGAFTGHGFDILHKFFEICKSDDSDTKGKIPSGGNPVNTHFSIELNVGDPELKPPRIGALFSGALNTRANKLALPGFIFKYAKKHQDFAKVNINKTVLTYSDGRLKTSIEATLRTS